MAEPLKIRKTYNAGEMIGWREFHQQGNVILWETMYLICSRNCLIWDINLAIIYSRMSAQWVMK